MTKSNTIATTAGLGLAGVGLSHFVAPALFEGITKAAFPQDTRSHVYINGAIETAVGLAIAAPKYRRAGLLGTLAYVAYLGAGAARNR